MKSLLEEIEVPTQIPSAPGQRDLFAELVESVAPMWRRCNRCGDLDQDRPESIYPASEPCCPVCHEVEFSLVSPDEVLSMARPKSATMTVTKTKLPKVRKTGKYKDEFDPTQFDKPTPAATKKRGRPSKADREAKVADAQAANESHDAVGMRLIALDLIDPDPRNARSDKEIRAEPETQEMVESVKRLGIGQPITVREMPNGRWQVIMGHRRRVWAMLAGLKLVQCIVREASDDEATALQIIENLHRKDLDPLQEAKALQAAITDLKWTQEKLAEVTKLSQPHISGRLKLLKLPKPMQEMIRAKKMLTTQARTIGPIADIKNVIEQIASGLEDYNEDPAVLGVDEFEREVIGAVEDWMRPMSEARGDAPKFVPTPEQLKKLDVRSLTLTGYGTEMWAANAELWDELQAAAIKQAAEEQAAKAKEEAEAAKGKKPKAKGTKAADEVNEMAAEEPAQGEPSEAPDTEAKPEVATLSPEEIAQREERAAAIYQKRLYRYQVAWYQNALRPRIKELTPEQVLVLILTFSMLHQDSERTTRFNLACKNAVKGKGLTLSSYADGLRWKEMLTIDRAQLPKILVEFLQLWCDMEARSFAGDGHPLAYEMLAREMGIDFAQQWTIDTDFLKLHTVEQLIDLMDEMKIARPDSTLTKKSEFVDHIFEKRATKGSKGLPACLAKLKPVTLD